jgi:hypothetical protein
MLSDNKKHTYEVLSRYIILLRNKEVIKKTTFCHGNSKFKGGNSDELLTLSYMM